MSADIITMADLVESVRKARALFLVQKYHVDNLKNDFVASIRSEMDLVTEYQEQLGEAERQLRAAALADHKATGNKHPHAAVTIRQGKDATACEYPELDALKFALEKQVGLRLDPTTFEAYMQAIPAPLRPAWFRVNVTTPEPTAAIAREIPAPETKDELFNDNF